MRIDCKDRERLLFGGAEADLPALEAHAQQCADCAEYLALWREIGEAAPSLRKQWDSPELWPRIHQALAEAEVSSRAPRSGPWSALFAAVRRTGWQAAAGVLLLVLSGAAAWLLLRAERERPRTPVAADPAQERRLLTEQALRDIENSEGAYIRSIDRLSVLAQPRLDQAASPLLVNYREKLTVIDAAIAECRAQIERNRFNTHLRTELLQIYREKQRTLEELIKEERNERN
jgi:hypothetical protein